MAMMKVLVEAGEVGGHILRASQMTRRKAKLTSLENRRHPSHARCAAVVEAVVPRSTSGERAAHRPFLLRIDHLPQF